MKLDPKLIDPNPYQPRGDLGDLTELAASIKAHGLQQKPSVRAVGKRYQLQFGHRRHAAWQVAFPGQPIDVEIVEATDQQMFEAAVVENEHRAAINPIERAQAMKRYIDEFKVSQAEAGVLFGLASQGAVSNAMRLLKLPGKAQDLVAAGEIAERDVRRLLPLLKLPEGPQLTRNILEHAAKQDASARGDAISNGLDHALRQKAEHFPGRTWEMSWPKESIQLTLSEWTKGTPAEIPACKGCGFHIQYDDQDYCLRPACFKAKEVLWMKAEVEAAAKKLGIPMAAANEKTHVIYNGGYEDQALWSRALKLSDRAQYLRIVLADDNGYSWNRRTYLGCEFAALATVDMAGLKKALPALPKEKKPVNTWERERKKKQARAKHCETLIEQASPHFVDVLPENKALLSLLLNGLVPSFHDIHKKLKKEPTLDIRPFIMDRLLREAVPHAPFETKATPDNAVKLITDLAKDFKVKLPTGWDVIEVKPAPAAKPKGKKK